MTESMVMLPWQRGLFKTFRHVFDNPDSQVLCILARRQICHKSASMLVCALHALCNSDHMVYGWFSPVYKQAEKQFNELKRWYSIYNLHCELKFNASGLIITCVDTGSKIQFYSLQEPDNIRGETMGGIFVDEACFVSDEAFGVCLPMVEVYRGWIVCASTPWQKSGMFWQLFNDPHTIVCDWTKYDLGDYVSDDRVEFYRRTLSPALFKTDILGEWLDEGESVLYGNISDCILREDITYNNDPLVVGIDVATGTNDYCAVVGFYMRDGIAYELFTERFRNGDVTSNVEHIYGILKRYGNYKAIMFETNGVGLPMYQLLRKRCVSDYDILRVLREDYWTGQSKGAAISDSVLWFNSKSIRLHSKVLIDECQSYTEYVDKNGKVSFGNAKQADRDNHDDCWCACLHALTGLRKGQTAGVYHLG